MKISTVGDIGDLVYLLNIVRQIPDAPHTLILRPSGSTKAKTRALVEVMFRFLEPLVNAQPYISDFVIGTDSTEADWASEGFRRRFFTPGETLMQAHLNHLVETKGIGKGFTSHEPWLYGVKPDSRSNGRVVVNLTGRYRNPHFDWRQVVAHYGGRILFVGLPIEHEGFCKAYGHVDHCPTNDLLEVARLIAGSELFMGNQSCAYACAEGLKHRSIQETSLELPDCVYGRPNATYCGTGECLLPDIAGSGEHRMKFTPTNINPGNVPPGGWKYPFFPSQLHIKAQVNVVSRAYPDMPREEVEKAILRHNADLNPEFFSETSLDTAGSRYRLAMQSAGF